jgi:type I restriction enzyme S subunit
VSTASSIALSEIMASKSGSVDPSKFPDEVFDLYSIPAFDSCHPEVVAGRAIGSAKQIVRPGDVLLSRIVPHIRRSWVVANGRGRRIIASGEWIVFRSDRVHPDYLRHVLVGDPFHAQFMNTVAGVGGSLLRARPEHVGKIKIPLPPLAEQRRIAAVLDWAEALRAKRRAALAQLDTLTQSIFLGLFGDPTLPEPTIGELLESGRLLLHKDGNHGSLYPCADDFGDEGVPFLSAKAVTDDGVIDNTLVENLREEKAATLTIGWICKGDVLLAHNASVGKVALYDGRFERALIGTSLTAFRPNPEVFDSLYLAAALRSVKFQRQLERNMGQTTRNQVPITAQRRLRILEPPISLQREFSHRIGAVEKLKATYRASLAELDTLFASLQYRAFRGEL